jgi:hypothetical protein
MVEGIVLNKLVVMIKEIVFEDYHFNGKTLRNSK